MDDRLYKHVLFKDLYPYLRRTDYMSGFSSTEQAYIRQNLGAIGQVELSNAVKNNAQILDYESLLKLKRSKGLHPGSIYIINNYQTIYQSTQKNINGKYISWGLDIHPSEKYNIIITAVNQEELLPIAYIINSDNTCTIINYDITPLVLDDGVQTKGQITYMLDQNRNQANFDFKNQLIVKNNKCYHLFSKEDGSDNSINCYYNNCCFLDNSVFIGNIENTYIKGNNNLLQSDIKNMNGIVNNAIITSDEIGLSNETNKNIIMIDNNYYIDYLDFETLTHQFYAISCG